MANRKKVLYLIDTIQGSGAERSLVEIAKNFTQIEPVFVHIYPGNMLKKQLEESNIKVYSLNLNKKYGFKEAVNKLIPIYNQEKPDFIHSTLYRADIVARKLKTHFPAIPLIGSFVNNSYTTLRYKDQSLAMKFKLWLAYRIDKQSSRKVDYFISNSETIKRQEGKALGIPDSRIKVIYRGRNMAHFSNGTIEEQFALKKSLEINGKNILLNVSRLIPRKGQLDILKAMPTILKEYPDTVLLIAGHGDYKNTLVDNAKKLNLMSAIKFLGRRQDIPELLDVTNIFVYPSYAEGLPGALIEAMMAGKIIIASDIGENLECINKSSALIFKKGKVDELAHKIIYALKNYSSLQKLGENAKIQAEEKFNIKNIANRYEDFYNSVLANSTLNS